MLGGGGNASTLSTDRIHIPKDSRSLLGSRQSLRACVIHVGLRRSLLSLPPEEPAALLTCVSVSAALLTCVGDAVLLILLPGLVDDAHPHQRGKHDAADHSDGEDAYGGPILPAAGGGQNAQLAVCSLGAQGIRHLTGVPACILYYHILNNQQLVAWSKMVPLGEAQRATSLKPGDARCGTPSRFALEGHCFSHSYHTVFQRHCQGRSFCRKAAELHIYSRGLACWGSTCFPDRRQSHVVMKCHLRSFMSAPSFSEGQM